MAALLWGRGSPQLQRDRSRHGGCYSHQAGSIERKHHAWVVKSFDP